MHRRACADQRVIGTELFTEIDALLLIGTARRELVADWEVTAPRTTGQRHSNAQFQPNVLREELAAQGDEARLQLLVNAVTDNVKEAAFATRPPKLCGRRAALSCSGEQRTDINDGDLRKVWSRIHGDS